MLFGILMYYDECILRLGVTLDEISRHVRSSLSLPVLSRKLWGRRAGRGAWEEGAHFLIVPVSFYQLQLFSHIPSVPT